MFYPIREQTNILAQILTNHYLRLSAGKKEYFLHSKHLYRLIKYFKESIKRKVARRKFVVYDHSIMVYNFQGAGRFRYARWNNPLARNTLVKEEQFNYYKKFIKQGDLAIDIGANIGDTTVPMGLAAGKNGMVLGFECNPVIFKILKVNEGLNPEKTNIKAIPFAISQNEEEFFYNSSEASLSNGGISREQENNHGKFALDQKVKSVNLEKFLNNEYPEWIDRLSFIKTDTEGHDIVILKSIESLIRKIRPVVEVECFMNASKEDRKDLLEIFSRNNYKVFLVDNFINSSESTELNIEDFHKMKKFDFVAIPG